MSTHGLWSLCDAVRFFFVDKQAFYFPENFYAVAIGSNLTLLLELAMAHF